MIPSQNKRGIIIDESILELLDYVLYWIFYSETYFLTAKYKPIILKINITNPSKLFVKNQQTIFEIKLLCKQTDSLATCGIT